MNQAQQLKLDGIERSTTNNKEILAQILIFIEQARACRLRMASRWDEVFTTEDLISQFELGFGREVPHGLAGAVGRSARLRCLIEETGAWTEANRAERHNNRVPVLRWALY